MTALAGGRRHQRIDAHDAVATRRSKHLARLAPAQVENTPSGMESSPPLWPRSRNDHNHPVYTRESILGQAPHNEYIRYLVETGVIGLAILLGALTILIRTLVRRRRIPGTMDAGTLNAPTLALVIIVGCLVNSLADNTFLYSPTCYAAVLIVIAVLSSPSIERRRAPAREPCDQPTKLWVLAQRNLSAVFRGRVSDELSSGHTWPKCRCFGLESDLGGRLAPFRVEFPEPHVAAAPGGVQTPGSCPGASAARRSIPCRHRAATGCCGGWEFASRTAMRSRRPSLGISSRICAYGRPTTFSATSRATGMTRASSG